MLHMLLLCWHHVVRCRGVLQAIEHDIGKADEADKSPDVHGNEQEEPASTTRTRQKASDAVDKVCLARTPVLTLRQASWLRPSTGCSPCL